MMGMSVGYRSTPEIEAEEKQLFEIIGLIRGRHANELEPLFRRLTELHAMKQVIVTAGTPEPDVFRDKPPTEEES